MSFGLDDVLTRAAMPADLDEIVSLIHRGDRSFMEWRTGWAPPPVRQLRDSWRRRLAGSDWTAVAVSPRGRVVGVVGWEPRGGDRNGPAEVAEAHLSALYVDPGCWRRGIATMLLAAAERAMRDAGYGRARLTTPEGAVARRFYESRGWHPDETRFVHPTLALPMVGYARPLAAGA
jgi:GNAT superfamily N-acetyltransferase